MVPQHGDLNKIAFTRNKMRGVVFLAYVAAAIGAVTVKDCSSGSSVFDVISLSFSPDVPVGGQNGTLHSVYSVPEEITAGSAKYSCALNGLPVYSETFDLCSQTACPIGTGTHDDFSTSEVPAVSGKVSCTIDWRSTDNRQLLCIQTIMNVGLGSVEKKALRGSAAAPVKFHVEYTPVLATNLDVNSTCPVEEFDPVTMSYFRPLPALIEPPHFHTHADHAKMSLMILRSDSRIINNTV
jgi:hypothetical protein